MLKGTLDDFTLPDVFRLMSFAKKTGRLDVVRSAGQGKVFFRDGEVYYAESSLSKEPLGQKLVRARALTEGQLMKALDEHAASGNRLGTVLIQSGVVTEEQLESAVRQQIEDSIFDLLRWELGEFGWEPNIELDVEVRIGVSVENLIMEASRRLDEFEVIRRKIPSEDAILGMAATPPEGAVEINITPDEWRVLVLVDGNRTVGDIAAMVGLDGFGAMRVLYGLVSAGLIELISEGTPDEVAEPVAQVRTEERPAADAVAEVHTEEPAQPAPVEEPAQPVRTVVTADVPELAEEPEPEPVAQAQPEPEPEPEPVAQAQPEPEPEPEPVAQAQPEPEPEPEPVAQAQPEPEAVAQAAPEPEPEAVAQAEPEPAAATSADPFADLLFDTPAADADASSQTQPAPAEPRGGSVDDVFASFGLLDDTTTNGTDAPAPAASDASDELDADDLAAFGIGPVGQASAPEPPAADEPATDEPAWPEPAAIESFDAPQADELVTSTPEQDPFVGDLFSDAPAAPVAEEPPAPPAPAPETPDIPVSSAPAGEAPSVDRAAVVRELAGLFSDEERPRPRPAAPAPGAEDDARKRVEDDDQVTKGIISRLIDGVKGL